MTRMWLFMKKKKTYKWCVNKHCYCFLRINNNSRLRFSLKVLFKNKVKPKWNVPSKTPFKINNLIYRRAWKLWYLWYFFLVLTIIFGRQVESLWKMLIFADHVLQIWLREIKFFVVNSGSNTDFRWNMELDFASKTQSWRWLKASCSLSGPFGPQTKAEGLAMCKFDWAAVE